MDPSQESSSLLTGVSAATAGHHKEAEGRGDKYRSFINEEGEKNTIWKFGAPPNYDIVNKLFEEGRTKIWPPGSLEEKVQNLVKTVEMELFNKAFPNDYKSIDPNKFTMSVNGRKPLTLKGVAQMGGGYNAFLQTSVPKERRLYNPEEETAETSHMAFRTAFPRGFALEILHVYCGPPVIVYKFRHWAYMEGPYKDHAPTGELIEFFGMAVYEVDEKMRVVKVELFFDRGEFLSALTKGAKVDKHSDEEEKKSVGCPFLENTATI